jgi:hypothetical protein
MAVECLSGHAKLHAQIYHLRLRLAHGRLGQAHPGGRHFIRAAAVASTGPRGGKPGPGALDDQRALELGQCCEDAEPTISKKSASVVERPRAVRLEASRSVKLLATALNDAGDLIFAAGCLCTWVRRHNILGDRVGRGG